MKKIKIALLTTFITVCAFAAVIYSSCNKDKCKGISCQNGVTACVDGTCQCPTGYYGNYCELSSILFRNDGYTPIYLTVDGSSAVLEPDSTLSFTGPTGIGASITAYTFGTNAANGVVGDTISWNINDIFPANGAIHTDSFNVPAQFFFLNIIDSSSTEAVVSVDVNYNIPGAQMPSNIGVPNDKAVHGIGYFVAYPLTSIQIKSNMGNYWVVTPPAIPDSIANEAVTVTVK